MKWHRRVARWIAHPRLPNEHGYAMAFWAIFLGTVMVPLMVLAWDVGRLFYARGEIQKAADAAALAAAREVDMPHYMLTGEVLLHQGAVGFASHYAERNTTYLPGTGISPRITHIMVNNTTTLLDLLILPLGVGTILKMLNHHQRDDAQNEL